MAILPTAAHSVISAYTNAANRVTSDGGEVDNAVAPEFSDFLKATLTDAIDAGRSSEAISIQAVSGKASLQDVVEAVNAAEISLQTVVSIRDRVLSAYQEVMRMPI